MFFSGQKPHIPGLPSYFAVNATPFRFHAVLFRMVLVIAPEKPWRFRTKKTRPPCWSGHKTHFKGKFDQRPQTGAARIEPARNIHFPPFVATGDTRLISFYRSEQFETSENRKASVSGAKSADLPWEVIGRSCSSSRDVSDDQSEDACSYIRARVLVLHVSNLSAHACLQSRV